MDIANKQNSSKRIKFIKAQGYFHLTDAEVAALAFGNRFAYILCASILVYGVVVAHIPILLVLACVAFATVVLPYHPFDYIYNHLLRYPLKKPELPPRSKQLKFACTIATIWISATAALFYVGLSTAGYIVGAMLISVAFIVVTTDFCIPSMIYNMLIKGDHTKQESCMKL